MKYLLLIVFAGIFTCGPKYDINKDPEVLDWYIDDNDTIIYKKEDSIRDARDRWDYHRSLAHDTLWE